MAYHLFDIYMESNMDVAAISSRKMTINVSTCVGKLYLLSISDTDMPVRTLKEINIFNVESVKVKERFRDFVPGFTVPIVYPWHNLEFDKGQHHEQLLELVNPWNQEKIAVFLDIEAGLIYLPEVNSKHAFALDEIVINVTTIPIIDFPSIATTTPA